MLFAPQGETYGTHEAEVVVGGYLAAATRPGADEPRRHTRGTPVLNPLYANWLTRRSGLPIRSAPLKATLIRRGLKVPRPGHWKGLREVVRATGYGTFGWR